VGLVSGGEGPATFSKKKREETLPRPLCGCAVYFSRYVEDDSRILPIQTDLLVPVDRTL